ncbi:hypothetical protein [Oxalobacter paraformigenes]|uniref:Uncharacterized protein n=1 Tax=Oxalobacter paraformigenes TaxID=556268 RepID=C3X362_9BURK|nr:hypothetical protein [Oxalobacter paraformigenes]EEO27648.1 hypothetical protein OFAG_00801 [Oxalobacter paraformigenes]
MTPEQIETEFWAAHYFDKPVSESVVDDEFDPEEVQELMERDDWEDILNVKQDRS